MASSNPQYLDRQPFTETVADYRRVDCQHVNACLKQAADWPAFHCNACNGYEALTPIQRYLELEPLLELAGAAKRDEMAEAARSRLSGSGAS